MDSQIKDFLENHKNKKEDWVKENLPDLFCFIDSSSDSPITWREKAYRSFHNIDIEPKCYCGSKLEFLGISKGYRKYCSVKCLSNSEDIKNKRKSTSIKKYGVDNPMKSIQVKKDLSDSVFQKYGVDNISKLDFVKNKVKESNNLLFGVDYVSQIEANKSSLSKIMKGRTEFFNKVKNDKLKNYLIGKTINLGIDFLEIIDTSIYSFGCGDHSFQIHKNMLNDRMKNKNTICTICNPIDGNSDSERNLLKFIESVYVGKIETNVRNIIKGEIDIYLPDLKIGFEYNGLYWHSDKYKSKNYHIDKSDNCLDLGVKLIHIWEDDWLYKNEIVKSRISNMLGVSNRIWARKCEVKIVEPSDSEKFLNENHIQGDCVSKIRLGIYFKSELIGIMTFGSLRKSLGQKSKDGVYEMLRFCVKKNCTVVGGASKLLNYFIKNYCPVEIVSYADRSWSDGALYRRLGFYLSHKTDPNYHWIIDGARKNRFNFRKDRLVKEGHDGMLSENQIMKNLGYHKIYDSGSYKFIYTNQSKN